MAPFSHILANIQITNKNQSRKTTILSYSVENPLPDFQLADAFIGNGELTNRISPSRLFFNELSYMK